MERSEVEEFFVRDDGDHDYSLVRIELNDSRTFIGYVHGWVESPYDDWIYFQEEDDSSGRMPRSMIKSITWLHEKSI